MSNMTIYKLLYSTNYIYLKVSYLESNLIKFFNPFFFRFFFEVKIHAWDFKIWPSLSTRKLFALRVSPVDVISVINSAEPVKG